MRSGADLVSEIEEACQPLIDVVSAALRQVSPAVTVTQLRALRVVRLHPGINLGGLAAELGVTSPTATQLCDRLEAAGLLDRQVAGHSRREIRLRLTHGGERVLAELSRLRRRELSGVLQRMTADERRALLTGLSAFAGAVGGRACGGRAAASER